MEDYNSLPLPLLGQTSKTLRQIPIPPNKNIEIKSEPKKAVIFAKLEQKEILAILEIKSWQQKILEIKKFCKNCSLVDSTADIYICNNQTLITKYQKLPIKIGSLMFNRISPSKKKV